MGHRRTDPACQEYRPPSTRFGRWWHDRNRGTSCATCFPPPPNVGWCVECSRIVRRWERCVCGEGFVTNGRCVFNNTWQPRVTALAAEELANLPDD